MSKFRDMIHVKMPASIASLMLNTEFAYFRSVKDYTIEISRVTKPYYLPTEIASVVSLVDDILRYPAIRNSLKVYRAHSGTAADPEFSSCGMQCMGLTTPDVLKSTYSFSSLKSAAAGNSMSVAEFQLQYCKNMTWLTSCVLIVIALNFNFR